jgi:hypothetical protein
LSSHILFGNRDIERCHTVQHAPALTVCKGLLTR